MDRVRVVVSGYVQGVFFRDSCRQEAQRRGLTGWVRNDPEGSVTAEFEGPTGDVEAMVAWCRRGPAHADVTGLDEQQVPTTGDTGFHVR